MQRGMNISAGEIGAMGAAAVKRLDGVRFQSSSPPLLQRGHDLWTQRDGGKSQLITRYKLRHGDLPRVEMGIDYCGYILSKHEQQELK